MSQCGSCRVSRELASLGVARVNIVRTDIKLNMYINPDHTPADRQKIKALVREMKTKIGME